MNKSRLANIPGTKSATTYSVQSCIQGMGHGNEKPDDKV
jgi:hypothetical protein